jgi:hypothetical protein
MAVFAMMCVAAAVSSYVQPQCACALHAQRQFHGDQTHQNVFLAIFRVSASPELCDGDCLPECMCAGTECPVVYV